ncbi:DUF5819 family protein [Bacteriovoracaceae bacterium]|nr:DUF5819 family protein [Bacteriovoracaceae bacterium]
MKYFKYFTNFLLISYLVLTILYLSPKNPLTNYYSGFVNRSIFPLFHQSWLLFAPDPATSVTRFLVKCISSKGEKSGWIDPSEKMLKDHHFFRLLSYGKGIYIYRNIARELIETYSQNIKALKCKNEISCLNKALDNTRSSHAIIPALKVGISVCSELGMEKDIMIAIEYNRVKDFSKRKDKKIWGESILIPLSGEIEK